MDCLLESAGLIPGTASIVGRLREQGIKIGVTTGYTRELLDMLLPELERHGFCPDSALCPRDVPTGRPLPWMIYQSAVRLEVYPLASIVKIGDTVSDIEEGRNAGAWTVAVAQTGNEMGLTETEWQAVPPEEQRTRLGEARQVLLQAGAHFVIDGVWEADRVVNAINQRLAQGDLPL